MSVLGVVLAIESCEVPAVEALVSRFEALIVWQGGDGGAVGALGDGLGSGHAFGTAIGLHLEGVAGVGVETCDGAAGGGEVSDGVSFVTGVGDDIGGAAVVVVSPAEGDSGGGDAGHIEAGHREAGSFGGEGSRRPYASLIAADSLHLPLIIGQATKTGEFYAVGAGSGILPFASGGNDNVCGDKHTEDLVCPSRILATGHERQGAAKFHIRNNEPVVGSQSFIIIASRSRAVIAVSHIVAIAILTIDSTHLPVVSVGIVVDNNPTGGDSARFEVLVQDFGAAGVGQHDVIHIKEEIIGAVVVADGDIAGATIGAQIDCVLSQHTLGGVVATHLGEITNVEVDVSGGAVSNIEIGGLGSPAEVGSMSGDVVCIEGRGSRAGHEGVEVHHAAPAALVAGTAVSTHLDAVVGVLVETGKSVWVGVNIDEVLLVAVEAELPSSLLATGSPAEGGGVSRNGAFSDSQARGPHASGSSPRCIREGCLGQEILNITRSTITRYIFIICSTSSTDTRKVVMHVTGCYRMIELYKEVTTIILIRGGESNSHHCLSSIERHGSRINFSKRGCVVKSIKRASISLPYRHNPVADVIRATDMIYVKHHFRDFTPFHASQQ